MKAFLKTVLHQKPMISFLCCECDTVLWCCIPSTPSLILCTHTHTQGRIRCKEFASLRFCHKTVGYMTGQSAVGEDVDQPIPPDYQKNIQYHLESVSKYSLEESVAFIFAHNSLPLQPIGY